MEVLGCEKIGEVKIKEGKEVDKDEESARKEGEGKQQGERGRVGIYEFQVKMRLAAVRLMQ